MDIKVYIESGILEQYLLGMTTAQESAEVVRYAAKYPEIQQELDSLEETLFKFAQAQAVSPRSGLKDKILANLDGGLVDTPEDKPSASPQKKGGSSITKWETAAMIIALASAVGSFLLYKFNSNLIEENNKLRSELVQLREECDKANDNQSILIKHMAVLRDNNTKPVEMKGTPLSPSSSALVYYNNEQRSVLLDINSLPTPAAGKQYQLWAIVDGKPVDMGVFDIQGTSANLKEVPFVTSPQAFAVTLEDAGGVESPTMDQMYVIGEI